jgi:hypothetical protein
VIIRSDSTEYVLAVVEALRNGELPARELSVVCPDCDQPQTFLDNDNHLVVLADEHRIAGGVVVVICCQGLWAIDPAAVGIDTPNWQGWLTWEEAGPAEPDDLTAQSRHRIEGATHAFYAIGRVITGDGWGLDLIQMNGETELLVTSWPTRLDEAEAKATAADFERELNPALR